MALKRRKPTTGLVHHSDHGVQYASQEYTGLLLEHRVRISMSRRGNPYDNARAESFMKTLKYEEVCRQEYRDMEEAAGFHQTFLGEDLQQEAAALCFGLSTSGRIRAIAWVQGAGSGDWGMRTPFIPGTSTKNSALCARTASCAGYG